MLTTRWVKKFNLCFVLHSFLKSFKKCPLVFDKFNVNNCGYTLPGFGDFCANKDAPRDMLRLYTQLKEGRVSVK